MSTSQHGGDLTSLSLASGKDRDDILDFSANMNPLGPPSWLREVIAAEIDALEHYPDPQCRGLKQAAAEVFTVPEGEILCGNGSSELLYATVRVLAPKRAVIPVPAYVDYRRACEACGVPVHALPLSADEDFAVDFDRLAAELRPGDLCILGQPNNPTGQRFDTKSFRTLAASKPDCTFLVDEAFADFVPGLDRLITDRPPNVVVLHSLTKFYAVPGLRLGLGYAAPEIAGEIKRHIPDWSVNHLAQVVGRRALKDAEYAQRTHEELPSLRQTLLKGLSTLPGLHVLPGEGNFLLCRLEKAGMTAADVAAKLLQRGIAIRTCHNYEGLGESRGEWFRIAVRNEEENAKLLNALAEALGQSKPVRKKRKHTPAIMVLGTCSNAGKSIIATALCRMLQQGGYRVAPFKSQNMSLNSYVTLDGGEMGRAQVTQAAACGLEPDVRMNPVLLKPGSDTGSQVIVMGKPVGNMKVQEYIRYKHEAFGIAKQAYDELAAEYDVIVLEGAGSPAEINLKRHDIVNTGMARYANADCLLVGDIDRGGVFASFVGTMELLDAWERKMIKAFVINKFRGDPSLLDEALVRTTQRTGVPFLGVVPHIPDLGLPDEDSVSFKLEKSSGNGGCSTLDIVVIDLPRISNADDVDPLRCEADVRLRIVRRPEELGRPDCIILPGSKNTIADLLHLRETGLEQAVRDAHADGSFIFGICAGYQMLGRSIHDPHGIESKHEGTKGMGLLQVETHLSPEKTLQRTDAVYLPGNFPVSGYEIHHGKTISSNDDTPAFVKAEGEVIGIQSQNGRVLGTYLHGILENGPMRRHLLHKLHLSKGHNVEKHSFSQPTLETALNRLVDTLSENIDPSLISSLLARKGL